MNIKLIYNHILFSVIIGIICGLLNAVCTPCAYAVQRLPELASKTPQELFDRAHDYLENKHTPDSALLCLTALTSLAETDPSIDISAPIYTIAYNAMGGIYASVYGNYSEAAVNLLKALDLAEQNGFTDLKNRIVFNLNAMEYEQGKLMGTDSISNIAINNFTDILKSLNVETDHDLLMPLVTSIVEIGIRENTVNEVIRAFDSISNKDHLNVSLKNLNQAIIHLNNRQNDMALQNMELAIDSLEESDSVIWAGCNLGLHIIKAHILLNIGQEQQALNYYEKIVRRCENDGDNFAVFEIYRHLKEYFEIKGDQKRAIDYELRELKAKDRLINRSRSLSLEGSRALYNEEKLKREIMTEVARSHTYKIVFWISLGFLIIVITLLTLLYRKFRQLKESRNIIVRNDIDYFRPEPPLQSQATDSAEPDTDDNSRIFDKVTTAIKDTGEIYDEEFSTGRLAELIGEKPTTVSAAILSMTGDTTTQFIARARIREACRRINDKANYGDYTIEAIGQSVGYRSRSHFGSVFKKIVGMTPSEYTAKIRNK